MTGFCRRFLSLSLGLLAQGPSALVEVRQLGRGRALERRISHALDVAGQVEGAPRAL